MSLYIMPINMYNGLTYVSGFIDSNGKNYQEHICLIFNKHLTDEQKKNIRDKKEPEEALTYLKTLVKYTHQY